MNFSTLDPTVDRWTVLRTSARWEKKIAGTLSGCGVPVFLPLTRAGSNQLKNQHFEVPLFAGYVFCSEVHFLGNPSVPSTCRKQIAQILRPPNPERLREELGEIADFLRDHQLVQERMYGKKGGKVQVIAGAFAGYDGVIVGLNPKKRRVVLEISFLHVRLEVEVEEHVVKKLEV
jgi:transcription antitermination factor NusG